MNTEVDKVIKELANEVLRLARVVLVEHGISEQSDLYKDVRVYINTEREPIVVEFFFNNYLQYIENGRAPMTGKKPSIEALKGWAESKKIPADNDTLYAISHAIWRDGMEPRPILDILKERVGEYIEREFGDKLSDAIISELKKYFE